MITKRPLKLLETSKRLTTKLAELKAVSPFCYGFIVGCLEKGAAVTDIPKLIVESASLDQSTRDVWLGTFDKLAFGIESAPPGSGASFNVGQNIAQPLPPAAPKLPDLTAGAAKPAVTPPAQQQSKPVPVQQPSIHPFAQSVQSARAKDPNLTTAATYTDDPYDTMARGTQDQRKQFLKNMPYQDYKKINEEALTRMYADKPDVLKRMMSKSMNEETFNSARQALIDPTYQPRTEKRWPQAYHDELKNFPETKPDPQMYRQYTWSSHTPADVEQLRARVSQGDAGDKKYSWQTRDLENDPYARATVAPTLSAAWKDMTPEDRAFMADRMSHSQRAHALGSLTQHSKANQNDPASREAAQYLASRFNQQLGEAQKLPNYNQLKEHIQKGQSVSEGIPTDLRESYDKLPIPVRNAFRDPAMAEYRQQQRDKPFQPKYDPAFGWEGVDKGVLSAGEVVSPIYRTGARIAGADKDLLSDIPDIRSTMDKDFRNAPGVKPLNYGVGNTLLDGVATAATIAPGAYGAGRATLGGLGGATLGNASVDHMGLNPETRESLRTPLTIAGGLGGAYKSMPAGAKVAPKVTTPATTVPAEAKPFADYAAAAHGATPAAATPAAAAAGGTPGRTLGQWWTPGWQKEWKDTSNWKGLSAYNPMRLIPGNNAAAGNARWAGTRGMQYQGGLAATDQYDKNLLPELDKSQAGSVVNNLIGMAKPFAAFASLSTPGRWMLAPGLMRQHESSTLAQEHPTMSPEDIATQSQRVGMLGVNPLASLGYFGLKKLEGLDMSKLTESVSKGFNHLGNVMATPRGAAGFKDLPAADRLSRLGVENPADHPNAQHIVDQIQARLDTAVNAGKIPNSYYSPAFRHQFGTATKEHQQDLRDVAWNNLSSRIQDPDLKMIHGQYQGHKDVLSAWGLFKDGKTDQVANYGPNVQQLLAKGMQDPKAFESQAAAAGRDLSGISEDYNKRMLTEFGNDPLLKMIKDRPWMTSKDQFGQAFSSKDHPMWKGSGIDPSSYIPAAAGLGAAVGVGAQPQQQQQQPGAIPQVPAVPGAQPPVAPTAPITRTWSDAPMHSGIDRHIADLTARAQANPNDTTFKPQLEQAQAMKHYLSTADSAASQKMLATKIDKDTGRKVDPNDPEQVQRYLQKPEVRIEAAKQLLQDPKFQEKFPNTNPEEALNVSLSIWDRMNDNHKWLFYGGLGIAALGMVGSMFGGGDDDEEQSTLSRWGPMLGLGGLAAAGYGASGGRPMNMLGSRFWQGGLNSRADAL